jgi:hypothetical protein
MIQLVATVGKPIGVYLYLKRGSNLIMQVEYQMQLPRRRLKQTKKTLKKRVTFSIAFLLLLGSTQAYAALELDTNIRDLIIKGIGMLTVSQVANANADSTAIEADYKTKLQESVTATKTNTANDLAQFTETELTRARKELSDYLDQKQLQMNDVVAPQVALSKQDITKNVNAIIDAIKQRLDIEFQAQLNQVWKQ